MPLINNLKNDSTVAKDAKIDTNISSQPASTSGNASSNKTGSKLRKPSSKNPHVVKSKIPVTEDDISKRLMLAYLVSLITNDIVDNKTNDEIKHAVLSQNQFSKEGLTIKDSKVINAFNTANRVCTQSAKGISVPSSNVRDFHEAWASNAAEYMTNPDKNALVAKYGVTTNDIEQYLTTLVTFKCEDDIKKKKASEEKNEAPVQTSLLSELDGATKTNIASEKDEVNTYKDLMLLAAAICNAYSDCDADTIKQKTLSLSKQYAKYTIDDENIAKVLDDGIAFGKKYQDAISEHPDKTDGFHLLSYLENDDITKEIIKEYSVKCTDIDFLNVNITDYSAEKQKQERLRENAKQETELDADKTQETSSGNIPNEEHDRFIDFVGRLIIGVTKKELLEDDDYTDVNSLDTPSDTETVADDALQFKNIIDHQISSNPKCKNKGITLSGMDYSTAGENYHIVLDVLTKCENDVFNEIRSKYEISDEDFGKIFDVCSSNVPKGSATDNLADELGDEAQKIKDGDIDGQDISQTVKDAVATTLNNVAQDIRDGKRENGASESNAAEILEKKAAEISETPVRTNTEKKANEIVVEKLQEKADEVKSVDGTRSKEQYSKTRDKAISRFVELVDKYKNGDDIEKTVDKLMNADEKVKKGCTKYNITSSDIINAYKKSKDVDSKESTVTSDETKQKEKENLLKNGVTYVEINIDKKKDNGTGKWTLTELAKNFANHYQGKVTHQEIIDAYKQHANEKLADIAPPIDVDIPAEKTDAEETTLGVDETSPLETHSEEFEDTSTIKFDDAFDNKSKAAECRIVLSRIFNIDAESRVYNEDYPSKYTLNFKAIDVFITGVGTDRLAYRILKIYADTLKANGVYKKNDILYASKFISCLNANEVNQLSSAIEEASLATYLPKLVERAFIYVFAKNSHISISSNLIDSSIPNSENISKFMINIASSLVDNLKEEFLDSDMQSNYINAIKKLAKYYPSTFDDKKGISYIYDDIENVMRGTEGAPELVTPTEAAKYSDREMAELEYAVKKFLDKSGVDYNEDTIEDIVSVCRAYNVKSDATPYIEVISNYVLNGANVNRSEGHLGQIRGNYKRLQRYFQAYVPGKGRLGSAEEDMKKAYSDVLGFPYLNLGNSIYKTIAAPHSKAYMNSLTKKLAKTTLKTMLPGIGGALANHLTDEELARNTIAQGKAAEDKLMSDIKHGKLTKSWIKGERVEETAVDPTHSKIGTVLKAMTGFSERVLFPFFNKMKINQIMKLAQMGYHKLGEAGSIRKYLKVVVDDTHEYQNNAYIDTGCSNDNAKYEYILMCQAGNESKQVVISKKYLDMYYELVDPYARPDVYAAYNVPAGCDGDTDTYLNSLDEHEGYPQTFIFKPRYNKEIILTLKSGLNLAQNLAAVYSEITGHTGIYIMSTSVVPVLFE